MLVLMTWRVMAEDKVCIQCATPNLRDKWSSTGLPKQPAGLKYDKDCADVGASKMVLKEWLSGNCASSCFELMVPVDGYYQYVRGCHEDFVWDEMKVQLTNGTQNCQVNQVPDYGNVGILTKETEFASAYAGTSFCPPVDSTTATKCMVLYDGKVTVNGVEECSSGAVHTCKSCEENDGTGSCTASTSGTCKGVYCSKTSGKLNGHFYESRGCASFNPFARDVCSWSDQTFNVSSGVETTVGLSFRVDQCFCEGELCNSTPPYLSAWIISIISLSFLVFA
uniref:Uncharacterized protein n=1 Tax=Caenorhabditis japonica TaxID=281687 RepID=A0A8R1HX40_CAEJA